jgi:8-oxo-dGTP pyrophosphatase MutT (NUDIX family)
MGSPLKTSDQSLREALLRILSETSGFERGNFETEGRGKAAVLALFRGETFLQSEILLILRASGLLVNPGQVALPGGSAEPADLNDTIRTALRETEEEVGLNPAGVTPLGLLPALPTVAGHFMVDTVLGIWTGSANPPLILQKTEVAHAEWMSVAGLIASRKTEQRVVHGVEMELPVFQWGEQRMWGLTAMIFDLIRKRYDKLFP